MSSCKENECIHCDTKRFLVEQYEKLFLKFLQEKVDVEISPENLKSRLFIISDMIKAIVGSAFAIIEKFESYMKEKDQEFPMNFFAEIFVQMLMREMEDRGLAYGISVPKEHLKEALSKNLVPIDPSKLN